MDNYHACLSGKISAESQAGGDVNCGSVILAIKQNRLQCMIDADICSLTVQDEWFLELSVNEHGYVMICLR